MFKFFVLIFGFVMVNANYMRANVNVLNTDSFYVQSDFKPCEGEVTYYDTMGNAHSLSHNITCTNSGSYTDECDYNGICTSQGGCKCDSGYITYPSDNAIQCNYKQKSMLIAFLLEFFIGYMTGAGRWYLGNTAYALAEVLVFWLGLIGACCIGCCIVGATREKEAGGVCTYFIVVLAVLTVVGLWLASWIMILTGQVHDSNGASLQGF